jgi:hypothetical protein
MFRLRIVTINVSFSQFGRVTLHFYTFDLISTRQSRLLGAATSTVPVTNYTVGNLYILLRVDTTISILHSQRL